LLGLPSNVPEPRQLGDSGDTKSFAEPLNSECLKKGTGRLLRVGDAGLHERFDLGPYTETSSPPTSSSPISTAMIGGFSSPTSVLPDHSMTAAALPRPT